MRTGGGSCNKRRLIWTLPFNLIAIGLACTACGGRGTALKPVELPTADTAPLSAPSEMLPEARPRTASYVEADLQRDGSEFDGGLPNNLVTIDAAIGVFSPNFIPENSLTDAAFATYDFNINGYDRNPQVRYEWESPPGAGHLWLGLSDWDADTWQWFKPDPAAALNLADIAPFIRGDGELLAVVLVTGTQEDRLTSLRIGSRPPVISWQVTNSSGFVPFTCSIDASATSDPDGTIASFEWDLDGDGSYEIGGNNSTQDIDVNETGAFVVKLRATDNDGVTAERQLPVRGFSEWQHSWGGGNYEGAEGSDYDGMNAIYVTGATNSFGAGQRDVFLLKYDLAGNLVWAETWGTGAEEYCRDVVVDAEGNVCVLCRSNADGAVLLKFSPDGEVLWSKEYLNLGHHFWPTALDTSGGDLYFCGYEIGAGSESALLAKVGSDGSPAWMRHWITGTPFLFDLQVYHSLVLSRGVMAAGEINENAFVIRLNDSGDLQLAQEWGGSDPERLYSISITGGLNPQFWLTGAEEHSDGDKALLLQYGSNPVGKVWRGGTGPGGDQTGYGIVCTADDQLWITGDTSSFGTFSDGMLLGYSSSGALQSGSHLTRGTTYCGLNAGIDYVGDALIASGWCNISDGTSWQVSSGEVEDRNRDWQSVSLSLTTVTYQVNDIDGALGEPTTAILDSGGGEYDCLVAVHQLP